jgi:CrcB protein
LRYYLGTTFLARTALPFPTSTFVINVTGSFIIGFFLTLASERLQIDPYVRLIVAVGFVGAYTTFSTFEYETAGLIENRELLYAFLYVALSVVVGFAAVWGGIVAARSLTAAISPVPTRIAEAPGAMAWPVRLEPALKLTIYVGGDERHSHHPLVRDITKALREAGVGGATITKGVMSFGRGRRIHSIQNETTMDNLPLIVEAIGPPAAANAAAAKVAELVGSRGLVDLSRSGAIVAETD